MIQSLYDLFKSLKESLDFTKPVYSKDLYMDGKKLNFIDYNETYMKNKNCTHPFTRMEEKNPLQVNELSHRDISCKLLGHDFTGDKHSAICKRCGIKDNIPDIIHELPQTFTQKLKEEYEERLKRSHNMKKDKFVKITKEQIDFLKQYGVVVHNEYYNYYHLPQIFAIDINDADPKEVNIRKNFTEVIPSVWKLFKNTGLLKVEIGQSESEKESTNYTPKEVKQQPELTDKEQVRESYDKFMEKFLEKDKPHFNNEEINKRIKELTEINKYCLDIASKLPNTCLKELFDNANKIKEYLEDKNGKII